MRILAIDQSFTHSGIVCSENDDLLHIEVFSSDPQQDIFQRAWNISTHIKDVANQFNPEYIIIEGLAFSKFGNATRDLAGLQFVLITTLRFIENYNVIVVSPNSVKKVATGKGNSKKQQMFECLPKQVSKKFLDLKIKKTKGLYDITDAYWIGKTGLIEIQRIQNANIRVSV